MVRAGEAGAVMKGAIHSDELLAAVVKKDGGLRDRAGASAMFSRWTFRRCDELLFISDAAINIAPDLMTKVDIVQNAIDLARACGIELPKVGILSAVETINPNIPSTLDAAILSKMAERGQITGAIVDGPLAMDNAIDVEAARTKGITSLVAGHANVLIVPNLESGNMLAKELTFVARAEAAGLVLGALVPVILTSRADNDRARLASCALAQLYDYWLKRGPGFKGESRSRLSRSSTMTNLILTINAGSSSIKFAAFEIESEELNRLADGHIEGIGATATFFAHRPMAKRPNSSSTKAAASVGHKAALGAILDWLEDNFAALARRLAVGHRVVHGGPDFSEPLLIDAANLDILRSFRASGALAPAAQHRRDRSRDRMPFPMRPRWPVSTPPSIASHPFIADTFALPRRFYDEGIRRYGFHGLSYEFIARRLRSMAPVIAAGRVIVAHLGNGASMCAMRDGRSIASTMGFTALDGLPMGTRCGQLDPGVVLYLMAEKRWARRRSPICSTRKRPQGHVGRLATTCASLKPPTSPAAQGGDRLFRLAHPPRIGGLAAALERVDAIVFTGGIGENAWRVREACWSGMEWIGVELDLEANRASARVDRRRRFASRGSRTSRPMKNA